MNNGTYTGLHKCKLNFNEYIIPFKFIPDKIRYILIYINTSCKNLFDF